MLSWNRWFISGLEYYLIPWPGPQVIFVALIFFDPLSIEMQSSPSKSTDNVRDYNLSFGTNTSDLDIDIWIGSFWRLVSVWILGNIALLMKFVVYFPVDQLEKWKDIRMKELRLLFISLTCSDDRIHYLDFLGASDMNTISVGTISWCSYQEIRRSDIFASFKRKMHLLAVLDTKINCGEMETCYRESLW